MTMKNCDIYSNKKETSDFHCTVSIDPVTVKMSQQKISKIVYQTSDTQNLVILQFFLLIGKS